jgi:hypothetical protein
MKLPVCIACGREMKIDRVGVNVEYLNLNGTGEKISADTAKCEGCGVEIVCRFAERPFALHFTPNYDKVRADVVVHEAAYL